MKKMVTFAILGVAASTSATADVSNYDYAQLDWVADGDVDVPGGSTGYDGFGAEGMKAIAENLLIGGGVDILEADRGSADADRYYAGFGMRRSFAVNRDYGLSGYGLVTYERLEIGSVDGNGLGLRTGLRFDLTPRIEINPQLNYANYPDALGDDIDGWTYGVRGIYTVNPIFAVSLGIQQSNLDVESVDVDLEDEIRLGARVYFE